MECVHPRCAGIDVAKKSATVCIRVQGSGRRRTAETVTTWGSMTSQILALREHLAAERVDCVVMESTGDYWKPFYYLLEDLADQGVELMLVNARHAKNVPGRKSDVKDSVWLADLGAHGLVRASFVPPPPIRELRDLTRTRTSITRERSREIQRLERLLQDAGIKLSSVASNIVGVSSRKMLQALVDGERDPAVLADYAYRNMRGKVPALTEALTGRFTEHHAFLTRLHLELIDRHTSAITELDQRIDQAMEPFRGFCDLICTIPGISVTVAEVIVAETGGDMTRFPDAKSLTSWAGVCPGSNQSGESSKPAKTRPGNTHLKAALGVAAMAASKNRNTYLGTRYRRIAARRGKLRAVVATERAILHTVWHMGITGALYDDPGSDFYAHLRPDREKRRALRMLEDLGYEVTLNKAS